MTRTARLATSRQPAGPAGPQTKRYESLPFTPPLSIAVAREEIPERTVDIDTADELTDQPPSSSRSAETFACQVGQPVDHCARAAPAVRVDVFIWRCRSSPQSGSVTSVLSRTEHGAAVLRANLTA
jgi:hypothetical protein